jgi:membrane fusion protein, heavy metal efflux system
MRHLHLAATLLLLATLSLAGCDRESDAAEPTPPPATTTGSHDHAAHAEEVEADDPHAGHDHAAEAVEDDDPHAGHDHAAEVVEEDDPHAGHDHAAEVVEEDDPHAGHDHAAEAGGAVAEDDGHGHGATEVGFVELTPEERRRLDLEIVPARAGRIAQQATFPGEIVANEERIVHIVPRAAGIVREVEAGLGEYVHAGEVLAWIESAELAQAKLAFFSARSELAGHQIETPRGLEIYETTHKMLALLETEPGVEELRQLDDLEMGEYRGQLVTAYAEYRAAKKAFEREQGLFEKSIASESDYIEAEAAYKKADAAFTAVKDLARFQSLAGYTELAQRRRVAEFQAVSTAQHLRLLGVNDATIARLLELVPSTQDLEPCLCSEPECEEGEFPSILETLGADERLGWYALRAPIDGYITEKHLTRGEMVSPDESIMTVIDTASVWVRFSVYQKDLALVRPGLPASVDAGLDYAAVRGDVEYLAPVIDPQTRTAHARLTLPNPEGLLRPGLYVQVQVDTGAADFPVVVEREAVQLLEETEVIFVEEGEEFAAVAVELGRSDREHVVILAGLEPGQRYVRRGAFELKAKIVTSGLGSHAGHGH